MVQAPRQNEQTKNGKKKRVVARRVGKVPFTAGTQMNGMKELLWWNVARCITMYTSVYIAKQGSMTVGDRRIGPSY